jgi:hypothetical protein
MDSVKKYASKVNLLLDKVSDKQTFIVFGSEFWLSLLSIYYKYIFTVMSYV